MRGLRGLKVLGLRLKVYFPSPSLEEEGEASHIYNITVPCEETVMEINFKPKTLNYSGICTAIILPFAFFTISAASLILAGVNCS